MRSKLQKLHHRTRPFSVLCALRNFSTSRILESTGGARAAASFQDFFLVACDGNHSNHGREIHHDMTCRGINKNKTHGNNLRLSSHKRSPQDFWSPQCMLHFFHSTLSGINGAHPLQYPPNKNNSHTIHVWYIYIHSPYKSTIHVGKYMPVPPVSIKGMGWFEFLNPPQFRCFCRVPQLLSFLPLPSLSRYGPRAEISPQVRSVAPCEVPPQSPPSLPGIRVENEYTTQLRTTEN